MAGNAPPQSRQIPEPLASLYRLDLEKCRAKFGNRSCEEIISSHVQHITGSTEYEQEGEAWNLDPCHFKSVKVYNFVHKKVTQSPSQKKANIQQSRELKYTIRYIVTKDDAIYVAANGYSYHHLKDFSDYKFPEQVLDRHLEEDVVEVSGKGLQGKVALYSKTFRQGQSGVENIWQHMNSLTTKLKCAVREDSDLEKVLATEKSKDSDEEEVTSTEKTKVFVIANFQNNSIQIQKHLELDKLLEVLNILIESFRADAPPQCAEWRLVSIVRDKSTQERLKTKLNQFLVSSASGSADESEPYHLHSTADAWNGSSTIQVHMPQIEKTTFSGESTEKIQEHIRKLPAPQNARVSFQRKTVTGDFYLKNGPNEEKVTVQYLKTPQKSEEGTLEFRPHEEKTSALMSNLYEKFSEHESNFDFLGWLQGVKVAYGKNRKGRSGLLSLLEVRPWFPMDETSFLFSHDQWFRLQPRFHLLLEVHFQEWMDTREIPSNCLLPLPWVKESLDGDKGRNFKCFLEVWLGKEISNQDTYDILHRKLFSGELEEGEYNEIYLLLNELMESQDRGFIVGDRATLDSGMEPFDLLYYDKENVFFIHVKKGFAARSIRVIADQLRHSAEFFECLLRQGPEASRKAVKKYFSSLKNCDDGKKKKKSEKIQKGLESQMAQGAQESQEGQESEESEESEESQGAQESEESQEGQEVQEGECSKKAQESKDKGCKRHSAKWACDRNKASMQKFKNFQSFVDFLRSRRRHFVLACGDPKRDKNVLHDIDGGPIQKVLQKFSNLTEELEKNGYIRRRQERTQDDRTGWLLTRRFCVETKENFGQKMQGETTGKLFEKLTAAMAQTEKHICKMAILSLTRCFENFSSMRLWIARIGNQIPDDQAIEFLNKHMENMQL